MGSNSSFAHEPPWDLLMGLLLSSLVTHLSLEEQGKLYVEQEAIFVDHVWISDPSPQGPKVPQKMVMMKSTFEVTS